MKEEKKVGTETSAKEYQEEMKKDNILSRREQTKSDSAMDKRDTGSRSSKEKGNMEGQGGQPTREGGKGAAEKEV